MILLEYTGKCHVYTQTKSTKSRPLKVGVLRDFMGFLFEKTPMVQIFPVENQAPSTDGAKRTRRKSWGIFTNPNW